MNPIAIEAATKYEQIQDNGVGGFCSVHYGSYDRHFVWTPTNRFECCKRIVASRRYQDSFQHHFLTLTHFANLYGISEQELTDALKVRYVINSLNNNGEAKRLW